MNHHPLEPLIKQYLAEKDITQGTRELYQTILKQYINYLKEHQILNAKTSDVMNYLEMIRKRGSSKRWIHHQITVLKGLYQYLSFNRVRLDLPEAYTFDMMKSIKNERIEKGISKPILTTEEAKHLILYLKDNRKYIWHYRDYALIYLMITTGLRSIEVRRARIKDLKMMNGTRILYVHGKGRSYADEYVKISDGLSEAIQEYLIKRKDKNPYLFVSRSVRSTKPLTRTVFVGMFRRILRDSGLSDTHITAHSLRHTAATINLLRGGTLASTKVLMRHKKIATTLIYAHHLDLIHDDSEHQIEHYILGSEDDSNNGT
ncbi:MAG: site-specific integrase [Firmicutes bacterium]|nr:site-specific integrase [Bacillota bacterium]